MISVAAGSHTGINDRRRERYKLYWINEEEVSDES